MLKGFKDFVLRGNVIDLAVAVVIGAAFGALVKSFTDAFITPVVNSVFYLLGVSGDGIGGSIVLPGDQVLNFGMMISAIIAFLITAAVVYFVFVAPMEKARQRFVKTEEDASASAEDLLLQIRDLLKEQQQR